MKTIKTLLLSALLSISAFSSVSSAQELQTSVEATPATVAPKWKAGATAYYYDMAGSRSSNEAAYAFDKTTVNLQLLTLQYELSPKWTLLAIGQHLDTYVETKMFGTVFKDRTTGFGDTILSAMTPLTATADYMVLADVGASLPTGSINHKNAYNTANNYAYNMQSGSGTVDAVAGLTALSFQGPVLLGTHLTAVVRNAAGTEQRNANGYALGNMYKADLWADYNTKSGLTPRLTGYYKHKDAVQGWDEEYERARETAFGKFYEFYHHAQANWEVAAALKYTQAAGPVTLVAEAGVPLAQNSQNWDDVSVNSDYFGSLSVNGTF